MLKVRFDAHGRTRCALHAAASQMLRLLICKVGRPLLIELDTSDALWKPFTEI